MRCFVAIELPEASRKALKRVMQEFPPAAAKWCTAEQLHVTLKFLGDVSNTLLPQVCDVVAAAGRGVPPFELTFGECSAFPSRERPRVIHCELLDADRGCERWIAAANPMFDALGFGRDRRPFTPHVTLGRCRQRRQVAAARVMLALRKAELARYIPHTALRVEQVVLFESLLRPGGAVYSVLQRSPLGGA